MSEAFADTSFFVAFLSARDVDHAAAVDLMENFEGRIVTTDWVLAELGNFLARCSIRNLFAAFVRDLPTDPRMESCPPTANSSTQAAPCTKRGRTRNGR